MHCSIKQTCINSILSYRLTTCTGIHNYKEDSIYKHNYVYLKVGKWNLDSVDDCKQNSVN